MLEWHACEIAGLPKAVPRIAKSADHYNHQFTFTSFYIMDKEKKDEKRMMVTVARRPKGN